MKGILIYDSSYGNTQEVAEEIADTFENLGVETHVFNVHEVKQLRASDYGFVILGSPTRFGTMSVAVHLFLRKLRAKGWANKPFATFDTETTQNLAKPDRSAAEKIAVILRDGGMRQFAPVLKVQVLGVEGPLADGEIERVREYAKEIATTLRAEILSPPPANLSHAA